VKQFCSVGGRTSEAPRGGRSLDVRTLKIGRLDDPRCSFAKLARGELAVLDQTSHGRRADGECRGRLVQSYLAALAREGQWRLLECTAAWDGNWSSDAFLAFTWGGLDDKRLLVCVNYAPHPSQCYVRLVSPEPGGRGWRLIDLLGDAQYDRSGDDLLARGLYLDIPPWSYHVFEMTML
jgi:hypothetical protein